MGLSAYRADSEAYNQSYGVGLRDVTKPTHGAVRSQPDRQNGPLCRFRSRRLPAGPTRFISLGFALFAFLLVAAPLATWADCISDCSSAYYSCRGNQDICLGQQGVCLSRCGLEGGSERHGAFAYSALKGAYGYSYDYGSSKAAESAAVRNCRKQDTGASDCKVLVTFYNACGALARGDKGAHGAALGMSQREAAAKALDACRPRGGNSCKIERQVCTGR